MYKAWYPRNDVDRLYVSRKEGGRGLATIEDSIDYVIRTNHIKSKIDKTQHNSRCRLSGDRDETINHEICECSKFA